jgi:uncharacterized protein YuzE
MKSFKFDYDQENDDLFVYLEGSKSKGSVELGSFVFDFDEKENLVAVEIFNAREVLSKLVSKILELSKIKALQANIINFRNMDAIQFKITLEDNRIETANIIIPRIKEESPALSY